MKIRLLVDLIGRKNGLQELCFREATKLLWRIFSCISPDRKTESRSRQLYPEDRGLFGLRICRVIRSQRRIRPAQKRRVSTRPSEWVPIRYRNFDAASNSVSTGFETSPASPLYQRR